MPTDSSEQVNSPNALENINRKILVLSGKGGVGKSTVAANLAVACARHGQKTGLLDVDLHGPSISGIFGLYGWPLETDDNGVPLPIEVMPNLKIVSIGTMLGSVSDAVIWRGPMKYNTIKQFLQEMEWGELDCLIIDAPPGTGDEPLAVAQLAGKNTAAVVVTTPQQIALSDVRRSISFCKKLELPVLGIIENMSGLCCPHCNQMISLFGSGGGERLARETGVPFLGAVPFDPEIVRGGDHGEGCLEQSTETVFTAVADKILFGSDSIDKHEQTNCEGKKMKIAIPTVDQQLCMHFGHCEKFAIVEADETDKKILQITYLTPPPHEPGVLPRWLREQGANVIIAGGMGQRAQGLFKENGIKVVVGAASASPETTVLAYLNGTLDTGDNVCDH